MNLRTAHTLLLASGILLPIVVTVLVGLARLLNGMGDVAGAYIVDRVTLGFGVVWVVSLVGLVLVNAFRWEVLTQEEPSEGAGEDEAT